MSFIIKGFDTDGNCLHCYFQSEDSDRCLLTDDDIPLYGKGHPDSCPLVPLPEGHGRLIDADQTERLLRDYADIVGPRHGEYALANGILKAVSRLRDVPTIIDPEGGGEDV